MLKIARRKLGITTSLLNPVAPTRVLTTTMSVPGKPLDAVMNLFTPPPLLRVLREYMY